MGLLQIEDVDVFADAPEVRLHLWIPLFLLVAEVAGGIEKIFRGWNGHGKRIKRK
jgi:hypothetical protein